MKQAYDYLYYKILKFIITINSKNSIAPWSALCFIIVLNFAFLFSLLIILHLYFGFDLYKFLTKFNVISLSFILLILNYFLLYHNKKHKLIMNKFKNENIQQKRKGNIIVLIIVLSVFISLVHFGSILRSEFIQNVHNKTEQTH